MALVAIAGGVLVRLLFDPLFGQRATFIFFVPAVSSPRRLPAWSRG